MVRWLVILGLALVVVGLAWPWLAKLGLGRLPGDVVIERENVKIYLPLATSVVVSVVASLVLWWLGR
jgi:hypothetical protein